MTPSMAAPETWPEGEGCFAVSPDGLRLAHGAADATVRIWDARTASPIHTLQGLEERATCLAFSADGGRLATGAADGTVLVWDADAGSLLARLAGPPEAVMEVRFTESAAQVLARMAGGALRVWDVASRKEVAVLWNEDRAPGSDLDDLLKALHALEAAARADRPGARRLLQEVARRAVLDRLDDLDAKQFPEESIAVLERARSALPDEPALGLRLLELLAQQGEWTRFYPLAERLGRENLTDAQRDQLAVLARRELVEFRRALPESIAEADWPAIRAKVKGLERRFRGDPEFLVLQCAVVTALARPILMNGGPITARLRRLAKEYGDARRTFHALAGGQKADELSQTLHATEMFLGGCGTDLFDLTPQDLPTVPGARAGAPAHGQPAALTTVEAGRWRQQGYEILGKLGQGGMGVVYKALQLKFPRIVALKMILSGAYADRHERARFQAEANAAASVEHPNIVRMYDVGESDGWPFLVMEYLEGGSLADRLNGTPWDPRQAAELVETLARAVHFAHQKSIVHRDLKPGNVLLAADGTPKVGDFSLAKRLDVVQAHSAAGYVMGTPSYMPPEQARGQEIGPPADVYSLGAILYELLTGRPPFRGPTDMDTLFQVLQDDPVPPRQLQPKTPRELETVCLKCLEKPIVRRYATALELAEELQRFLAGQPVRARPVAVLERGWKWVRRRPAAALLYLLLLAILVQGVGAACLWLGAEKGKGEAEKAEGQLETVNRSLEDTQKKLEGALQRKQTDIDRQTASFYADRMNVAQLQWSAGAWPEARAWLKKAGDLPEESKSWEFAYLDRTFKQEPPRVLEGHKGAVLSVAFSPDGGRLATAGADGTVQLWDVTSGKALAVLKGHIDAVRFVAFSPGGDRVASAGGDGTVRLWDAASGKQLRILDGWGAAPSVAFSPDGRRLAAAKGATVGLLDAATGELVVSLKGRMGGVAAIAFSPDGGRVAAAAVDGTVQLWDATTGEELDVLVDPGQTGQVISLAFSPDGSRLVTAGDDGVVRFRDDVSSQRGGEQRIGLDSRQGRVRSVAFSPDGSRLVTAGDDGTVKLWDVASGQPLGVLKGHAGDVFSVAFSPDGARLATAGEDGTARLWDAASGEPFDILVGQTDGVASLAFSPNGRRIIGGDGHGTARQWDAATGKELDGLKKYTPPNTSYAYSPDGGRVVRVGDDNTARLSDAHSGDLLAELKDHTGAVTCVAFSPDGGRVATASKDGTVRLWDAFFGNLLVVLEGHTGAVTGVAFSPDGGRLATAGDDGTIRLWIAREPPGDGEKRRRFWCEQQADAAEKDGRWLAAVFYLGRLIDADPADPALYLRRGCAYAMQGRGADAAADYLKALALVQSVTGW